MNEPTYLHPTPNRRRMLDQVAAGRVFRDAGGHDYLSGERKVDVAIRELEAAGWVELRRPRWTFTPYGRAVMKVRVLDFGELVPEASPQMVAEVGDGDEPKVLGHVLYLPGRTSFRWQVTVGADVEVVRKRQQAWGELWHRACLAYAALPPISQP